MKVPASKLGEIVAICPFCLERYELYPNNPVEQVRAHIETCAEHPMARLLEIEAVAKAAVAGWRQADRDWTWQFPPAIDEALDHLARLVAADA